MLTTKFQSRPIIVDAVQAQVGNIPAIQLWIKTVMKPAAAAVAAKPAVAATATTPAQPAVAAVPAVPAQPVPPFAVGDWVVRDSFDRFFVLSNEMFHLTYDALRNG